VGSHNLHIGDSEDPFELTNESKNEYGANIHQARSVAISEENAKKLDGMRSRNHFQGGYYTTSTKM
jgi:hypothetical protein